MRISDWSSDVCSSDLPVILRPRGEEGIRLRTADATMPGSVLFVGRRCGDEVGGCAEQRLLQRLDALGEGGVLGREGDSIRDTALLHEGLQLRSEEHTSELQSLMRISYAVFCLNKKTIILQSIYS